MRQEADEAFSHLTTAQTSTSSSTRLSSPVTLSHFQSAQSGLNTGLGVTGADPSGHPFITRNEGSPVRVRASALKALLNGYVCFLVCRHMKCSQRDLR